MKVCFKCNHHHCHCNDKTEKKLLNVPVIKSNKVLDNKPVPVNVVCATPTTVTVQNPTPTVVNHCPTNRIQTISKIGDKVIVTMDDCTFYESDEDTLDLRTFNLSDVSVIKITSNPDDNTLAVIYHNNRTGKDKTEILSLPDEVYVNSGSTNSDTLTLVHNTGSVIKIDLTSFKTGVVTSIKTLIDDAINKVSNSLTEYVDTSISGINNTISNLSTKVDENKIKSTALGTDKVYTIILNDGTKFTTDLSGLISPDNFVHTGSVINDGILHLVFQNGTTLDIDLKPLLATKDTVLITGGNITGTNLILDLSNGSHITVDISTLLNNAVEQVTNNIEHQVIDNATQYVVNNILNLGYRINNQSGSYSLVQDDFDGRTLIRYTGDTTQTFTITKPDNETISIGRAVVIRKVGGNEGTILNLVAADGVTITPPDITPLRRLGSAVTLVYTGSGNWDVFGELP